jgi:hypothetical protein
MDAGVSSSVVLPAVLHGKKSAVTTLHAIVGEYLDEFVELRRSQGRSLQPFVLHEFSRFLECGDVNRGYAGVECPNCGILASVPISCNRRAWCPRCLTRRMMERGDIIADQIVGDTPVRHYVGTFPPPLRYGLLYLPEVASEMRSMCVDQVLASLRRRAKRILGLASVNCAYPGAIVASQRCSSNLAPNFHLHMLVTDGVFVCETPESAPIFRELPPPTEEEVAETARAISRRACAILKSHGLWREDVGEVDGIQANLPAGGNDSAWRMHGVLSLRANRPGQVVTFTARAVGHAEEDPGAYSFDLYARRAVAKGDRDGVRKLARYIHHPPFTDRQLGRHPDDRVVLKLDRPRRDGTTQVIFERHQFMEKLVHLVPYPRSHTISYHGVYGPGARLRDKVLPKLNDAVAGAACDEAHDGKRKLTLLDRIARMNGVDLRKCPHCTSPTTVAIKLVHRSAKSRSWPAQDSLGPPQRLNLALVPGCRELA